MVFKQAYAPMGLGHSNRTRRYLYLPDPEFAFQLQPFITSFGGYMPRFQSFFDVIRSLGLPNLAAAQD